MMISINPFHIFSDCSSSFYYMACADVDDAPKPHPPVMHMHKF